jgi:tyrosyl-tRNA synthetase
MTLVPVEELEDVLATHGARPEARVAQRRLALEVTALVHGEQAARAAEEASQLLFGGGAADLTAGALATLAGEIPTTEVDPVGTAFVDLVATTGLASSKSDARRALAAGELWLNAERIGEDRPLGPADLRFDRYVLLRRGKKRHHLVVRMP